MSLVNDLNWAVDAGSYKGKTEHSGAKKGKGAWTSKEDAKQSSKKRRRQAGKQAVKKGVAEGEDEEAAASLVEALDWSATGRECGDEEAYPEKCTGPGEGYDEGEDYEGWGEEQMGFDPYPDEDEGYEEGLREEQEEAPWYEEEVEPGVKPSPGGDWQTDVEKELEEEEEPGLESPEELQRSIEEEEKLQKFETPEERRAREEQEAKQGAARSKRAPRDPRLGEEDYHQFWQREDLDSPGGEGMVTRLRDIMHETMSNPRKGAKLIDTPTGKKPAAEVAREMLHYGPHVMLSPYKTQKGKGLAEDIRRLFEQQYDTETEERGPIV